MVQIHISQLEIVRVASWKALVSFLVMICGKKVSSTPLNSWMAESHQWQSRFGCPSLMGYPELSRSSSLAGDV